MSGGRDETARSNQTVISGLPGTRRRQDQTARTSRIP